MRLLASVSWSCMSSYHQASEKKEKETEISETAREKMFAKSPWVRITQKRQYSETAGSRGWNLDPTRL